MKTEDVEEVETEEVPEENPDMLGEIPDTIAKAVEEARDKGFRPYWIMLNGYNFVYRPINRKEWRELTKTQNRAMMEAQDDPEIQVDLKNEQTEKMVRTCLIYSDVPVDDNLGAGYVDTLFDVILVDSGFGQPDMPSINMS